jgi:hypothetical protein
MDKKAHEVWPQYIYAFKRLFANSSTDLAFTVSHKLQTISISIELVFIKKGPVIRPTEEKRTIVIELTQTSPEQILKQLGSSMFHSYMTRHDKLKENNPSSSSSNTGNINTPTDKKDVDTISEIPLRPMETVASRIALNINPTRTLSPTFRSDSPFGKRIRSKTPEMYIDDMTDFTDSDDEETDISNFTEDTFWKKQSTASLVPSDISRLASTAVEFNTNGLLAELEAIKRELESKQCSTESIWKLSTAISTIQNTKLYCKRDPTDGKSFAGNRRQSTDRGDRPTFRAVANAIRASGILRKMMIAKTFTPVFEDEQNRKSMGAIDEWVFDIFRLDWSSKGRSLYAIVHFYFEKYSLLGTYKMDQQKLHLFLRTLETQYGANGFHNSTHASDVVQTLNIIFEQSGMFNYLTNDELLACILAAAAHDFKHPGLNNMYLINSSADLALRYNDRSILENYHIASTFELLKEERFNFLSDMDPSQYRYIRELMIELVLATDLSLHHALTTAFDNLMETSGGLDKACKKKADRLVVMKMMIKLADISNPFKPLFLYLPWVKRLQSEFFYQGQKEKERGVPISPFCNQDNCNISKCQLSFIDHIVTPMLTTLVKYLPLAKIQKQASSNREFWLKHNHISTLEGIDNLITEEFRNNEKETCPSHFDRQEYADGRTVVSQLDNATAVAQNMASFFLQQSTDENK